MKFIAIVMVIVLIDALSWSRNLSLFLFSTTYMFVQGPQD